MTQSLGENFLQYKCAIYPLNLIDYPYKLFYFLHPKLGAALCSELRNEAGPCQLNGLIRIRGHLMLQPSRAAESGYWGYQVEGNWICQHISKCKHSWFVKQLFVAVSLPSARCQHHGHRDSAPALEEQNRQEVQMKRTKMGRKAVDQEDKSDGKDSIQLSRGWHFVMDGPRPRIQNNRIAVGEKSQTGVKLWRCDYSVYQLN